MKEFLINSLKKKEVQLILALFFVAVAPLLLQRSEIVASGDEDVRLIVMTPHNVTIRAEFSEAFSKYWHDKTGKKVFIDWRTPGGTAEIRIVLDGEFKRSEDRGDEGIGKDLLFGGGDYLFKNMAAKGRFAKLDVFENNKQWFGKGGIRERFSGERCYGKNKQWVGVCMSEFGICYNTDGIKRIGLEAPTSWDDLADPKYYGKLALADPTKSGSAARAFEMLIQQKISKEIAGSRRQPGETSQDLRNRCIREGWAKGMQLIQKISANARYFTDSASKIPHDVAQGDAVAGMCIDFYGRTYNEKLKKDDGTSRLVWISPKGGTSTGADPVAVFRGAPHPEIAQGFVEFLLTEQAQMIWNKKSGTKNGPKYSALRRLPIRPDLYTPENMKDFTDADQNPYERKDGLVYDETISGELFEAMREEIRVMCIDTHYELSAAWKALIENRDENGKMKPDALKRFNEVALFSYKKTGELKTLLDNRRKGSNVERQKRTLFAADRFNDLAAIFRRQYSDARKRAKKDLENE